MLSQSSISWISHRVLVEQTRFVCIWVILLSLISKRVYMDKNRGCSVQFIYGRALTGHEFDREMKNTMLSLVNKSLPTEDELCPADGTILNVAKQSLNGVV